MTSFDSLLVVKTSCCIFAKAFRDESSPKQPRFKNNLREEQVATRKVCAENLLWTLGYNLHCWTWSFSDWTLKMLQRKSFLMFYLFRIFFYCFFDSFTHKLPWQQNESWYRFSRIFLILFQNCNQLKQIIWIRCNYSNDFIETIYHVPKFPFSWSNCQLILSLLVG